MDVGSLEDYDALELCFSLFSLVDFVAILYMIFESLNLTSMVALANARATSEIFYNYVFFIHSYITHLELTWFYSHNTFM